MKSLYKLLWRTPLGFLVEDRLSKVDKGYSHFWLYDKEYQRAMYDRQLNMDSNPPFEQVAARIKTYSPTSVLEIGCGFGRILKGLLDYGIKAEGCDVSQLLIDIGLVPIFRFDLVTDMFDRTWDVVFCRAVFMYFSDAQIEEVMHKVDAAATTKVIVWEWAKVIERMKPYATDKFEFHVIQKVNE